MMTANEMLMSVLPLIRNAVLKTLTSAGYDAAQIIADDIVQDLACKLLAPGGFDRYDASKAELTTWVHHVAVNFTIDALRKTRNNVRLNADGSAGQSDDDSRTFEVLPASPENPERATINREKARRLHAALATLSETDRLIFETLAEDATEAACVPVMEATGLKLSNVRKRLCLIKQKLAAQLAA